MTNCPICHWGPRDCKCPKPHIDEADLVKTFLPQAKCKRCEKLERALAHFKAALSYAYEDTGDMYYLNVKEKIEEILK